MDDIAGVERLVQRLAERTPTPGGGAAAATAAALGCAAGAMAARYTTGTKWGALSDQARALAEELDRAAADCLRSATADSIAYAAVGEARKSGDRTRLADAERAAAAVPAELLALCAAQAAGLAAFLPLCNPLLASDVRVAVHLLAGAGRAAWQTLAVNRPGDEERRQAAVHLAEIDRAEAALRAEPRT